MNQLMNLLINSLIESINGFLNAFGMTYSNESLNDCSEFLYEKTMKTL